MSFYQEIRTAKAAAIGTIMPWTGGISSIPNGWIPCDGSQISAGDFPLLSRAIGDTYNLSTAVTEGLIENFAGTAAVQAGRIPGTYIYSPLDGSGGGANFAIIVGDAGTQSGNAPNGVGGTVTFQLLAPGVNYVVGDVLSIPGGNSGNGSDMSVAVQSIKQGSVSTFGGEFPNYAGEIVLPNLLNRPLVDVQEDYFGPGTPTGRAFDQESDAFTQITPYIGANSDTGVPTSFNDVATDVVFELNERNTTPGSGGGVDYYYGGKLQGNIVIPGSGEGSKVMFFGPRKLGRGHIKGHGHGGRYDTIKVNPTTQPGEGVIPWSSLNFNFTAEVQTSDSDIFITNDNEFDLEYTMGDYNRGRSGLGGGQPGRTLAIINAESPPVNWTPKQVTYTPIQAELNQPLNHRTFNEGVGLKKGALSGGIFGFNKGPGEKRDVDYGIGGIPIANIGSGLTNWYPDLLEYAGTSDSGLSAPSAFDTYDTFNSNPGWDFGVKSPSTATQDQILAHTHDEFDVNFDRAGMRPENSINVYVTAPNDNLNLDNSRNVGVFQINLNTTQPGMTCVYVIRAY
jgi:hypothetical protein